MTQSWNALSKRCPGPPTRRGFMQMGLAGFATLSLPGVLRLRAENLTPRNRGEKAVILVWKPGGCSHIDTYDPKPIAPGEYRGPFSTIPTAVPGLQFSELLPLQAKIAEKLTVLRSMRHGSPGHDGGTHAMLCTEPGSRGKRKSKYPDWMSIANYLRSKEGPRENPLPVYVGINPPTAFNGPAYLGDAYEPFTVTGDPNQPSFHVPNIGLSDAAEVRRLGRRASLRKNLDTLQRSFDRAGELRALDEFETQAMTLLTNPKTKVAFDLSQEDDRIRDRYGRNAWGQQLLMARRLVEAGVEVLTTSMSGPLCGRVGNWDDHAVNHHVFDGLRFRAPAYDQAVSALIEDIYERGLDKRVLVVVSGEFGRTPKVNYQPSTGAGNASAPAGTKQPGRDHWARAFSNIWAGGGIETGRFIGETDKLGEDSIERICGAGDFVSTIYHHLGIDSPNVLINDFNGRPTPIVVDHGQPIPELIGASSKTV